MRWRMPCLETSKRTPRRRMIRSDTSGSRTSKRMFTTPGKLLAGSASSLASDINTPDRLTRRPTTWSASTQAYSTHCRPSRLLRTATVSIPRREAIASMVWCARATACRLINSSACPTGIVLQSWRCQQVHRAVSTTWSTCSRRASVFPTHRLRMIGLPFAAASVFSTTNPKATLFSRSSTSRHLSNPSGGAAGAASLLGLSAVDPHLKVARTTSYSLGVQREMPWGILLEASYVGNEQRHILRQPDINLPTFAQIQANAALPAPIPLNRLRPYQGYTSIRMYLSDSTANYNAFQVYATKRKGDFMATVSYTWSKTLADSSSLTANPDNWRVRRYNYGLADFDRRHVFATTYFYDSPLFRHRGGFVGAALGGWQLSGITRVQSGPPITILATSALGGGIVNGISVNSTNVGGRRADRVPGVSLAPTAP